MRRVLRVIAPVVAVSLTACGPAAQSVKPVRPSHATSAVASPTVEPDSSPTATPASVPSINDAVSLASELTGVEQAIRIPDTATEEYVVLGQRQQQAYHLLLARSEEHTSELQSRSDLVCRLLLEKKKTNNPYHTP